ncbi:glutaredoxin family protein [Criibacterium bergeronii]|uniref:Glutaredoxin family protein n=1 Tax=Criibacterium bergeronii TaxID=1871336 RepID=A0A371IN29_9FIRM|nr:glutaredoxin family protein [Criibacterium bergeronii]MBS6062530.1 glutaredoxin family protein [Peptostreptococcaceae bacterium]RDY21887.1 glutaredoxin family protein [Criibacterium bergeronii]TRW26812.1 glutaredoxin family protein [Criibacterium bergeronii]
MENKNVVVYTSSSCHYCHLLKDYLNEKNISFDEKNIDQDPEARSFLIKNKIMGVPATYIDDEQIIGFDKARLDKALGL